MKTLHQKTIEAVKVLEKQGKRDLAKAVLQSYLSLYKLELLKDELERFNGLIRKYEKSNQVSRMQQCD